MDLATIIGLVVGTGLILAAITQQITSFVNVPSIFIVIGGGVAATLISTPLRRFLAAPRVLKNALFARRESSRELIEDLVRYGEIARRDGILALEGVMDRINDPFMTRAIQLAVDGNDPEVISSTLKCEMESLADRHDRGRRTFELLGKYAPAFGMIGTLIGLVLMLAQLNEADTIAPNMAVALLTTLYGAVIANLIALPIADKLGARSDEELQRMNIVMQGVIAIQSGDNPKVVEQKLQIYLPPAERSLA